MKSLGQKPVFGLSGRKLPNAVLTSRTTVGSVGSGKKSHSKSNLPRGETDPIGDGKTDGKGKSNLLKPEDQLPLQEWELKEEITRTLTTTNPQTPKNLVEYSYRQCEFVPKPPTSTTVVLLHLEGCAIPRDSPEAQAQLASCDIGIPEHIKRKVSKQKSDSQEEEADGEKEEDGEAAEETGNADDDGDKGDDKGDEEEPDMEIQGAPAPTTKKKLTNAFNFCERAALASSNPTREVATQTVPPPRKTFTGLVTQWVIFDAYAEDYEKQLKEKEKEKKPPPLQVGRREDVKKKSDTAATEAFQLRTYEAANIIDRMICQNIYDEIAQDYKYYEDPSDEYRSEEGTLLPLWKFSYEKTKKSSVTDISWNPQYYDLFAVTFGTFDFSKQPEQDGAVCLFTLKNPSFPEYARHTECSAMSVSTHPIHSYLIVIGLHDGNVAVYNTKLPEKLPQFRSNSVKNKHWGIVWQVKWGIDLPDGEINFYSVSADGKVCNWILMQNELAVTLVISLRLPLDPVLGPDGSIVSVNDCGCTINFHPTQPLVFLVGTEQGSIYKCSTEYSSMFLFKYDAHYMPVHKISYNLFYPDVFLSCSADWRVKIWEDMKGEPLFVFDLGCSVGDVQWAPHSSTVFAAVTVDGKCHIFDINVNKYKSICDQNVVSGKKNRLTRLRFNYKMPIIIVGDDKGCLTSLKLSPNLRTKTKPPKKQQFIEQRELEIMKLEKLLALSRKAVTRRDGSDAALDNVMEDFFKSKTLLKPDDQLDIPESELKEEVARFLISVDMRAPKNVVEYSFKEGGFVSVPPPSPTVTLVHRETCVILKDSVEGQAQMASGDWDGGEEGPVARKAKAEDEEDEEEPPPEAAAPTGEEEEEEGEQEGQDEKPSEEAAEGEGAAAPPPGAPPPETEAPVDAPRRQKKLPNAFNFCERAAMTYNNPFRDMACQTIPLPRSVFSGIISGWMIYDFYAENFEKQQKEKEKEKKPLPGAVRGKEPDKKKLEAMLAEALQMKTVEAAKILDRMICQNLYDDIAFDYMYYEDPSDEYRVQEGTLLPLWKFCYEKTKKLTVTEINWSPLYYDLFAVTFGSYDFLKQPGPGALCLFTLKNPSYPEFIRLTEVSLLSVSIHPDQAYLIAVGKYDGNIAIYNKNLKGTDPQYESNSVVNKHSGPVWQVRWGPDLEDGELNVFSISCDGRVKNWVLMQSELVVTTVITLTLPIEQVSGPDGALVNISASGSAIAFHPQKKTVYMVGTEEGKIFKCSSLYGSKYLFTYEAHTMPVHKISFNRYCPSIFLSCSGDWTVKIWEDLRASPLFCFDLNCSVSDAQWAPYSSSVFAAVGVDGKCHVFDLNVNKYKAICVQNVVSRKEKNRISRMKFNYHMPIMVVGDERGTITTLKLSPNLRLKAKAPKKKDVVYEQRELEIMKLEKILAVVREPPVLTPPPDRESI